jgi:DNA-binding NtrC family response regulator
MEQLKIFYIEEKKFLRDMVELAAKQWNMETYTTKSAKDCMYLIKDIVPDVLIVDHDTAQEAIQEFIAEVKKLLPDISILVTAERETELELNDKMKAIIRKPISPTHLKEEIIKARLVHGA